MANQEEFFKKVVSHAKEYGFIFPSSEIYDGLAAVYDYGQLGTELKNNIKQYWWRAMVQYHENIVGIDSAITRTSSASTPPSSCTPASGKLPATWMPSTTR